MIRISVRHSHTAVLCMHMLQSRCILTLHRVLIRDRLH